LFREGDECLGSNEGASFNGTSGGERPARSTLSLILDWSNSSFSNPVPAIWDSRNRSSVNRGSLSEEGRVLVS
jgi:hypothetical protein